MDHFPHFEVLEPVMLWGGTIKHGSASLKAVLFKRGYWVTSDAVAGLQDVRTHNADELAPWTVLELSFEWTARSWQDSKRDMCLVNLETIQIKIKYENGINDQIDQNGYCTGAAWLTAEIQGLKYESSKEYKRGPSVRWIPIPELSID